MFAGCGSLEWVTGEEDIISTFKRDETRELRKEAKEKEMAEEAKRRRDLLKGGRIDRGSEGGNQERRKYLIFIPSPSPSCPPPTLTVLYSPII